MQYRHVNIEALGYILPAEIVTSAELEEQLRPVYEKLHLPAGRLELMTGIKERRFFPVGTRPGKISAETAKLTWQATGLEANLCGAVLHGSVCRDQLEPATANLVHHLAGFSSSCMIYDLSNACLGLLNGVVQLANMIELGQVKAGIVVGTEDGRTLVENTITGLLSDETITRQSIKAEFASLTIGSASAAIVLTHRDHSRKGSPLLGGYYQADTHSHELCAGGNLGAAQQNTLRMQTDSEALLHAGINLAKQTWPLFLQELGWKMDSVNRVATHQVGKAHRKLLLESLGLAPDLDYPTVEFLGNTGAVALPI